MTMILISITSWIIFEAALASMAEIPKGQCSLNNCTVPNGKTLHDMCLLTQNFMECLNSSLVQNSNCRIPIRKDWELRLSDIEQLIMIQGCFKNSQAAQLYEHPRLTILLALLLALGN